MKNIFISIMVLFSSASCAVNIDNELAIASSDTQNIKLPNFDYIVDGSKISLNFNKIITQKKYETEEGRTFPSIQRISIFYNNFTLIKELNNFPSMGQNYKNYFCQNDDDIILIMMFSHGESSKANPFYIYYRPVIFRFVNNRLIDLTGEYSDQFVDERRITSQEKDYIFSYRDKSSIWNKAFAIGLCKKKSTLKMNVVNKTILPKLSVIEDEYRTGNIIHVNWIDMLNNHPINIKNVEKYNNIAFYLIKNGKCYEAIFLLQNILYLYPYRTVANLNIADAYQSIGDKTNASVYYSQYRILMREHGNDALIPKRALGN